MMTARHARAQRLLAQYQGYLDHTRGRPPSFTGRKGREMHEQHEADLVLLVELLTAESAASA